MNIAFIEGDFSPADAEELISQMILIKIKYHENKIGTSDQLEDVKMREKKIIKLQNSLAEARTLIRSKADKIYLLAEINL